MPPQLYFEPFEPPPRHDAPRRRYRRATLHAAAAVAAPRGRRAPDPIARRSNLDLDAVGLGRGEGVTIFFLKLGEGVTGAGWPSWAEWG